jgi:hypothetical protein
MRRIFDDFISGGFFASFIGSINIKSKLNYIFVILFKSPPSNFQPMNIPGKISLKLEMKSSRNDDIFI